MTGELQQRYTEVAVLTDAGEVTAARVPLIVAAQLLPPRGHESRRV